jgi:hypothetical protein
VTDFSKVFSVRIAQKSGTPASEYLIRALSNCFEA